MTAVVFLPVRTKQLDVKSMMNPYPMLFATLCVALSALADDRGATPAWSGFQNGGQLSFLSKSVRPVDSLSVDWTIELDGYGQSSPLTWDDQIYVTTVVGENKDTYKLTAYATVDGKQRWQESIPNPTPQPNNNYVSRAAPTPVLDADGIYAFFEGGVVAAFSHDGKQRWSLDLVDRFGTIEARHGLAASVEQSESSIFVWVERAEEPYAVALNKSNGKVLWKSDGVGATSWASPRLVPVGDAEHLVLSGIGSIIGLDPKSGERLWTLDNISGNSTPTPIPLGDRRFLIGATVGRGDSDSSTSAASNGVVQIAKNQSGWSADYVWRATKATSSFGSPLAHNGIAYFVNRSGALFRLDLDTGELRDTERLGGSIWATPVGVGSQVMFFTKAGEIVSVSADADKTQLIDLSETIEGGTLYAGVVTDHHILVRTGSRLFRFNRTTSVASGR